MSIQKPIYWSDIQDLHTNNSPGSTQLCFSELRGKLVFDTALNVGRNLPKAPYRLCASDFENTVPYQNTTVKPPTFAWTPLGNPVPTVTYDSGNYQIKFFCKVTKPAENASWGNAIPAGMFAEVVSSTDSSVSDIGVSVLPANGPGGGTEMNVTVKLTIPTNRLPLTRRYQVRLNLDYIYPIDLVDAGWITNPLSQGRENFNSMGPALTLIIDGDSDGKPTVVVTDYSRNQTNTSATVKRYENYWLPDVNTTKTFGRPYLFRAIIPGRTLGYENIGTVWELIDSDISYTITYYPYNPSLQQDGNSVSPTVIQNVQNANGNTTDAGYNQKDYIPGSHSVTTTYDTVLGYGATTSRMVVDIEGRYRNKLTNELHISTDSITVNGGSHAITKVFVPEEEPEPTIFARLLSITSDYEPTTDTRTGRTGVQEYDNIYFDLVFDNAAGKTYNLYIAPGEGGFYVSGISTGPYGVPQFSPSLMITHTVPGNNRDRLGPYFIATGTGKKFIGSGTVAVMVEYVEDGRGTYRWVGTDVPSNTTGSITGISITYEGQGLTNSGLSYSITGSYGTNAKLDITLANGKVDRVAIINGGSGYKIGEKFTVQSTSFGGQKRAELTITRVGNVQVDMSPDAYLHTTPVVDKPAGNFRGQLKRNTTVYNEGSDIEWFVIAENLSPDEQAGFWAHSFPGDAVAVTPGAFTAPYVGSGTGYRYNGSLATLDRPNHYEDVTGDIKAYWTPSTGADQELWWESGTITIKNTHTTTTSKPDPEPVAGDLDFTASNRARVGPGGSVEITAAGSITFQANGSYTKRKIMTGGLVNSSTSTGTAVSPSTADTDWQVRITPGSARVDDFNESDVDFAVGGDSFYDNQNTGNFTRSVSGSGSTFSVSLIGEYVRWREAQVVGSCTWELYNTVSKEIKPGGSISGIASIYVGSGDDFGTAPPPVVEVRNYCEIWLGDDENQTNDSATGPASAFSNLFNSVQNQRGIHGYTGYRIYEWSDGTTTRVKDDSCLNPQITTATVTNTTFSPPLDVTWCANGNRYRATTVWPYVVMVRANDPTCTDNDTTTTTTRTTTTAPPTTTPPADVTFCDPLGTGHRMRLVGDIFSGFRTEIVVHNDPTCAPTVTTAPPTTTRTTTTAPPTGPAAGTIVPGTESCLNGTRFWSEYTGIGMATVFKFELNSPACIVTQTTTQPPITTRRTTAPPTTTRAATITHTWCAKNRFGLNTGNYVERYSDGTTVTTYRPDQCPLPVITTAPPTTTTRPPTTTTRTIRPTFDNDLNRDPLRRTDDVFGRDR